MGMSVQCPYCSLEDKKSGNCVRVVKFGQFFRKSDGCVVQRFRCYGCRRSFSEATRDPCFKQLKRQFNSRIAQDLVSGVSQRRLASNLTLNRKTIVRKFIFLGLKAEKFLVESNFIKPKCRTIEFDDLETIEHTKLKPLSVSLVVEFKTRRILGFRVSRIPAKGHLAALSFKKYGFREDKRASARTELFKEITPLLEEGALIKSDQNPHYLNDVKRFFPKSKHETHKGRRGCVVGQGELKKIGRDPLFSLNHTCAMLRANINRLFRKTWCTTKKPERLSYHIALYAVYHNQKLKLTS
jgi:transposase-like protein